MSQALGPIPKGQVSKVTVLVDEERSVLWIQPVHIDLAAHLRMGERYGGQEQTRIGEPPHRRDIKIYWHEAARCRSELVPPRAWHPSSKAAHPLQVGTQSRNLFLRSNASDQSISAARLASPLGTPAPECDKSGILTRAPGNPRGLLFGRKRTPLYFPGAFGWRLTEAGVESRRMRCPSKQEICQGVCKQMA